MGASVNSLWAAWVSGRLLSSPYFRAPVHHATQVPPLKSLSFSPEKRQQDCELRSNHRPQPKPWRGKGVKRPTRPLRMTTILSARFTVLRRWAMRMTVMPPRAIMLSIACCTRCSLSASNALFSVGNKPKSQDQSESEFRKQRRGGEGGKDVVWRYILVGKISRKPARMTTQRTNLPAVDRHQQQPRKPPRRTGGSRYSTPRQSFVRRKWKTPELRSALQDITENGTNTLVVEV